MKPYEHTYEHGPAEFVTGTFGTYCLGCYHAATYDDDAAGITITTPTYP